MKYQVKSLVAFLVLATLFACGGGNNSEADDKLGKLEIEIPEALEDNKEVVEFIEGMAKVSDDYALMLDETLEKAGEYIGKESEELSMMEQMKLIKITGEVAIKSTTVMAEWGEYLDKRSNLEEQLSDEELKALETVMKRFEKRMEQIEAKHSEVLSASNE